MRILAGQLACFAAEAIYGINCKSYRHFLLPLPDIHKCGIAGMNSVQGWERVIGHIA